MKRLVKFLPSILLTLLLIGMFISRHSICCFCSLLSCAILPFAFEFISYYVNKSNPLKIETPDGSNQPYHPSVLFFKIGWSGYKYWMSYTPFPINGKPYRDRFEYPCLCVSNDGIKWSYYNNIRNIDDLTEEEVRNRDYFSDSQLVYDSKKNEIDIFYRLSVNSHEGKDVLYIKKAFDGKDISERQYLDYVKDIESYLPVLSPAIPNDEGYIWFVSNSGNPRKVIRVIQTNNLMENVSICSLKGKDVNPWHIDCQYINNIFYLVIYDFSQEISLWESLDGTNFSFIKTVLEPSHIIGSFYRLTLYRSCLIKDDIGYKLYFSAGNERKVKIGLMQGESLENMKIVSGLEKNKINNFIFDFIDKYTLVYRWVLYKIFEIKIGIL